MFEMKSKNRDFLTKQIKRYLFLYFSTLKSYSFDKVEKRMRIKYMKKNLIVFAQMELHPAFSIVVLMYIKQLLTALQKFQPIL